MGMLDEYDEAVQKDVLGSNKESSNPGYIPGVGFTNSPSILGSIKPRDVHTKEPVESAYNAHTISQYACPRCSKLSSLLSEMASNPPGFEGVETSEGHLGNSHIDLGWVSAINMLATQLKE